MAGEKSIAWTGRHARCGIVDPSGIVGLVVAATLRRRRRGGLGDGRPGLDDGGGLLGALEAPGGELWGLGDGPQKASCLWCA